MKSILTYLAVLTLSFNVFAAEARGGSTITATERIELNQDNSPANNIVNNNTIPQASAEQPSEFITALSVYLIIIVVYSIYGYRAKAKNIEH